MCVGFAPTHCRWFDRRRRARRVAGLTEMHQQDVAAYPQQGYNATFNNQCCEQTSNVESPWSQIITQYLNGTAPAQLDQRLDLDFDDWEEDVERTRCCTTGNRHHHHQKMRRLQLRKRRRQRVKKVCRLVDIAQEDNPFWLKTLSDSRSVDLLPSLTSEDVMAALGELPATYSNMKEETVGNNLY